MTPTIDQLLDEPVLYFTPAQGNVAVEAVAQAVEGIGFAYRDERDPSRFAIFPDAAGRDACRDMRRADPSSTFPYVLRVTVRPDVVVVFPEAGQANLRALSAELIEWLRQASDWRITNEFNTDMSDPAAYVAAEPAPAGATPASSV